MRDQLHPVADAEDRHPQLKEGGIDLRRPRLVDALRAAREDQADGPPAPDLRHRQVERLHLAVDPVLAHPASDELRVLAAAVEDEDGLVARARAGEGGGRHRSRGAGRLNDGLHWWMLSNGYGHILTSP